MKLFLQDIKDLARILQEKLQDNFRARFWSNLARKLSYNFLTRLLQDFYILQEKLHFSARFARYVQDLVQNLASLARKMLARLAYFLQDGFTGFVSARARVHTCVTRV